MAFITYNLQLLDGLDGVNCVDGDIPRFTLRLVNVTIDVL